MTRAREHLRALAARARRMGRRSPKADPAGPVAASRFRLVLVGVSLAVLSAITGVISYSHGLDVARWVGNAGLVAYLVPLVPDLMIVTSSLTLIEASAVKAPRPLVAMLALLVGIGWTVAQNIAAGWRNGPGGAVLAAGIPLAFVFTFESLLWLVRRGRGGTSATPVPATPNQDQPAEPPTTDEALQVLLETGSRRVLAETLGVPKSRVDTWAGRVAPAAEAGPEPSMNGNGGAS